MLLEKKTWQKIIDIENAAQYIRAISRINILHKPQTGIIGVKWEETRQMFGKKTTEIMVIDDSIINEWYKTTAYNCACKYNILVTIDKVLTGVKLSMRFRATPKTFLARLMSPLGILFAASIRKALQKDLVDLKLYLEKNSSNTVLS